MPPGKTASLRPSIIIPARDEEANIARTIRTVRNASGEREAEIIVVDDGSADGTGLAAKEAGARVLRLEGSGNPGRARNAGAAGAIGDPLIFLDADCRPEPGWLDALMAEHDAGRTIAGGSLDLPPGLPFWARCDYYATSYHFHSHRAPGVVANHTPANLSVRREVFTAAGGFTETFPVADGHEELAWQHAAASAGHSIHFIPKARALHENRPGFGNLLRRGYRWGYSAVESKAAAPAVRAAWMYRHPGLLMVTAIPAAFAHTGWISLEWLRSGTLQPLWLWPGILLSRLAYATGMIASGARRLRRDRGSSSPALRWR
ncbi:MAG: glycosyltransferase [Gemmatimonadales bacterium]